MVDVAKRIALGLLVAIAFFFVIEGILWAVGVVPLTAKTDPYVGFAGYSPLFVESSDGDGQAVFSTAHGKLPWFNPQRFPARKENDVTRVFCMGGSTTFGRPYDDRTSFCGWLRAFLPAVDPDRRWEVINAGGVSYASYRVTRLMESIARHQPDLFIIYTGHNEFLESRTYAGVLDTPKFVRNLASLASRLRLYSLLAEIIRPPVDVLSTEVDALLDSSVGPEDYHRDDDMSRAVLQHFRESIERMVTIADRAVAQLIFVTPASNIGDFSPFKAEPSPGLSETQIQETEAQMQTIARELDNRDPVRAAMIAESALNRDPRNAALQFLYGRALRELGRMDESRQAFIAALDEDVAPLRALSPVPGMVADVARANNTGLVDFAEFVEERSPERIPGNELFMDHVHPTIEGHRLLALEVILEMIRMELISPASTWNDAAIAAIAEQVESGVDEEANVRALTTLSKVLHWAGKFEEAERVIDRSLELSTSDDNAESYFQKARLMYLEERYEEGLPYAEQANRLVPQGAEYRMGYGLLLSLLGRTLEARQELEQAVRLNPNLPTVHHELGIVLGQLGEDALAETEYRNALESEPDNADTLNNLGVLVAKRGEIEEAAELFERALRSDSGHANAANNLGRAQALLGR